MFLWLYKYLMGLNKFPRNRFSSPLWYVFSILRFLRNKALEPIAKPSIKSLIQKTLFLVMLACSRRISAIHALSGLDKAIEFARQDSACFLSFLPVLGLKNQNPLFDTKPVQSKSLSTILNPGDGDGLNCPVRIITTYLARTLSYCLGKRCFFLSLNKLEGHFKKLLVRMAMRPDSLCIPRHPFEPPQALLTRTRSEGQYLSRVV